MRILFWVFILIFPLSRCLAQDSIDSFIRKEMKQQGIEGLSVGIVKGGRVFKATGYGLANVELNAPATETTMFKIGSLSKQFMAAGIMKLVQDGRLALTDPVKKFIPAVPPSWDGICIRRLLNHSSGLPADPPGFDGMKEVPDSAYVAAAGKESLAFPPGSQYAYSNLGYFVLADIIRIVSGLSFPEFMQKNIFGPSGMMNTRTTSVSAIIRNRAAGYTGRPDSALANAANWVALRPSGAFFSDIDDLLKWEMIMQQSRLLTAATWTSMWTDTILTPYTMDEEKMYYGYGWMTNRVAGAQLVHHAGSLPGFKSVYLRYPKDKTAIIILCNADAADAYAIAFGISDLLQKVQAGRKD